MKLFRIAVINRRETCLYVEQSRQLIYYMYIFHSRNCIDYLAFVSSRMPRKECLAKCVDVIYNCQWIYIPKKKGRDWAY